MNIQIDVTSAVSGPGTEPPANAHDNPETVDLLRQLLDVQRDQLAQMRATAAMHDNSSRWRAFLNRWQEEFPGLGESCRKILPLLEQTYGRMILELTQRLADDGPDALDNDFSLQEFLDRYGMRLAQLGTILNLVGPLADASNQADY